ncbi:MAG: class I SAM-dependent methyltransferase [Bacteroidales bacterium]|nr:class I SAM-dependent methyltransferase [Bacteroidales bacterium]MBN2763036.1 class I SAM-dependent methyltransferase [Bacteroidales bacterium]
MAKTKPFDEHLAEYEQWFIDNRFVFQSELAAIQKVLPAKCNGVEIGVGSGIFASKLGIMDGVEPSFAMREKASERNINAIDGVAEELPYPDESYDFALMVTTICFVNNVLQSFKEVHRILRKNGVFIIGFVDKNSPVGKVYFRNRNQSVFYKDADFYSTEEVYGYLSETGFKTETTLQTVFGMLNTITEIQMSKNGYGEGSFVVIKAKKE